MPNLGLSLGLVTQRNAATAETSFARVSAILGARDGFAISFVDKRMKVQSSANPGLNFTGDPESRLTRLGTDPYLYDPLKGLVISAGRNFGVTLATALFPFNAAALHVFARFHLNSADAADQRHLLQVQLTGNNRFAVYTQPGSDFRFVTGNGTAVDTKVSAQPLQGGVERRVMLGADAWGKTFVNDGGVVAEDATVLAAATPAAIGIGGYNNQVLRVLDGHLAEIVVITEKLARETRLVLDPVRRLYAAEGDSHTYNSSYGVSEAQFYPALVAAGLGTKWVRRNAGGSGDSSPQMVGQLAAFLAAGVPDVASIYAGSNDQDMAVLASPVPAAGSFAVSEPVRLGVNGWISVGGAVRQIAAIAGSLVTLATPLPTAPAAGAAVVIETQKNLEHWVNAVKTAGCSKVLIVGSHYLNFAANGDTPAVQQSLRAAVRARQQAAAMTTGCIYVDSHAAMRATILAGAVVQGDDLSWHVATANTHLNAAGEAELARAVQAAVVAQGWGN